LGQPWRCARCRYVAELERVRDDADRQREHAAAMFDQVKDLADRRHRERQAELTRPWWHRLRLLLGRYTRLT
jgi:hypothetical protein